MSVRIEQLTKQYGEQKALDGISFSTKPGEILGFLGPNGAGKSTTMKILTCYIPQTSGVATVCGYDTRENPLDVRRMIGYLPEQNPLYTDMYVKEYLHFAASLHDIHGASATKRVAEMIESVGLIPERNKKIGQLSKGYRQRVGLAQAMIHQPNVLILDEPTSGLDPNQVIEIRDLIKAIGRDRTVIFSTHIMQEVEAMCNRVVIINKGKIVADNTVENLRKTQTQRVQITVEFKHAPATHALEHINGVMDIQAVGNRLSINADKDVREDIAQLAMQQGWMILTMTLETYSIEQVFQQLTQQNNPHAK